MPDSWAKAFAADDRLVGLHGNARDWKVSRRDVLQISVLTMPVSMPVPFAWTRRAMAISSRLQLPARSPMPLTVHSTWRAPGPDGGERIRDGQPQVVVAMHGEDDTRHLHVLDEEADEFS